MFQGQETNQVVLPHFWFGLTLQSLTGKNQTKTKGKNVASPSAMTKVTAHIR